jgi:putative endonuclease
MTSEIEIRVRQHKDGSFEGYSKKYNCNRLVWFERHPYVHDAIAREKQLKGWSRAKKIWLIERDNPSWVDLSEEWGRPMKMFMESGWSLIAKENAKTTAGPSTSPLAIKLRVASLRMAIFYNVNGFT